MRHQTETLLRAGSPQMNNGAGVRYAEIVEEEHGVPNDIASCAVCVFRDVDTRALAGDDVEDAVVVYVRVLATGKAVVAVHAGS